MLIYLITNLVNGKKYVGKTGKTLPYRWQGHKATAKDGSNYPIHKAIRKYGTAHFTVETLATADNYEDLSRLEIEWIARLNTTDRAAGYNLTKGGEGMFGFVHSDRTKAKIPLKRVGPAPSPEARKRMGDARRGKTHTPATKLLMASHWDEDRREAQAEIARQVNARENAKLKDYACDRCGAAFTQVVKGVWGGHRKACMARPIPVSA